MADQPKRKNAKDIDEAIGDLPGLYKGDPAIYGARAGYTSDPVPQPPPPPQALQQQPAAYATPAPSGPWQDPVMQKLLNEANIPGVTYPTRGVPEPGIRGILRQLLTPRSSAQMQADALEAERY